MYLEWQSLYNSNQWNLPRTLWSLFAGRYMTCLSFSLIFFSRRTGPNGKPEINENERNLLITSKNNKQQWYKNVFLTPRSLLAHGTKKNIPNFKSVVNIFFRL